MPLFPFQNPEEVCYQKIVGVDIWSEPCSGIVSTMDDSVRDKLRRDILQNGSYQDNREITEVSCKSLPNPKLRCNLCVEEAPRCFKTFSVNRVKLGRCLLKRRNTGFILCFNYYT